MTIETVIATIGCTEEQARELLSHMTANPVKRTERGVWTVETPQAKFCAECGKNQ